jgi:hypothetical protein
VRILTTLTSGGLFSALLTLPRVGERTRLAVFVPSSATAVRLSFATTSGGPTYYAYHSRPATDIIVGSGTQRPASFVRDGVPSPWCRIELGAAAPAGGPN